MKLAGVMLTFLGCVSAALTWTRSRKARLGALDRLAQALGRMEAEITAKAVPLPALIAGLAESADGAAGRFFRALSAALGELGERPFAALWAETVQSSLPELSRSERAAIAELGNVLGRYPIPRQQEALACCRAALLHNLENARGREREDGRLVWGLALSAGALILIVLI